MSYFALTDIFVALSSLVVVITALAVVFKKIRTNFATNLASLINVDDLKRESSLFKTLDVNNMILEQINHINEKNTEVFEKINQQFQDINKSLLRLEIISVMDHRSNDEATIYRLFEEYKDRGGNSYIDKLMKDWENGNYLSVDKMVEKTVNKKLKN